MLNDRLAVAMPIAREIKALEEGINAQMVRVGNLLAAIPEARAKVGQHVPLEAGVEAAEKLAGAATALAATYRQVVEAHGALANDRDLMGLRAVAWGDLQACPKNSADADAPKLRVVDVT